MKLRSILLVACIVSALLFGAYCVERIPRVTHDFGEYYRFSRALLEGKSLAPMYDYGYFNAPEHAFGIAPLGMPNNLPTNALMLLIFAWLDPMAARIAWSLFSLACLAWAIRLLLVVNDIKWKSTVGLGVLTLILVFRPAYENVTWGQMYFFLLLLFSLSLRGYQSKRPWLTALPIAVAIVVKGYGFLPLIWLIATRRWKEAGIVVATTVAIIFLSLPFIGAAAWDAYYHHVFLSLGQLPTDGIVNYQTINSFFRHFLHFDAERNTHPIFNLTSEQIFPVVIAANVTCVFGLLWLFRRKGRDSNIGYAAMIAAGVVTAPLAMEYHFLLCLPLIVAAIRSAIKSAHGIGQNRTNTLLVVAISILAMPFRYEWFENMEAPLALLGYVKLYAALGLLVMCKSEAVFRRLQDHSDVGTISAHHRAIHGTRHYL